MATNLSTSSSEPHSHDTLPPHGWPWALTACLLFCVLSGLATWGLVRLYYKDDRKVAVLVGDSFVANYRLEAGERLEDRIAEKLGPEWRVVNYAWPGSRPSDFLLEVHQARMLTGRVDLVVANLFPDKFLPQGQYVRFNRRGDWLKWLPWGDDPAKLGLSLDEGQRTQRVVHKLGLLLFAPFDVAEQWFTTHVQQVSERKKFKADGPERAARIEKYAAAQDSVWALRTHTPDSVMNTPAAQDMALLVQDMQARGTPLVFTLLPFGNPGLVKRHFGHTALARVATARAGTEAWLRHWKADWVDLEGDLSESDFDDLWHVKSAHSSDVIADHVADWVRSRTRQP